MLEPVSTGIIVAKEAAEKAALAIQESLKLSEVIRNGMERLKTSEISKLKDLYRNPSENVKAQYNHLFKSIDSAKSNPELRASLMNRMMREPNLIGQMGEYHAGQTLSQYGSFERQIEIPTERGTFRVDFAGKLTENMPVKSYTLKEGVVKSTSEVIRAGEKIGVEVKNGLYEIRQNPDHVMNQALAAKELTGKGFIGMSQSMLETISKTPDVYSNLFEQAAKYDLIIIVTQPTMTQQIANFASQI
jgi:hypothetical protein